MSAAQARILALGFLLQAAVFLFPARRYPLSNGEEQHVIAAPRGVLFYHPYQERKENSSGYTVSTSVLIDYRRMIVESLAILSLSGCALMCAHPKTPTRL